MGRTPGLQDLAFYARDRFEEEGHPSDDTLSSFEVVMETYVREADETDAHARASAALHQRLQTQGCAAGQAEVDEFVHKTVTYLRCQYPRPTEAKHDQAMLSHLFRAHVEEARLARTV